MVDVLHTDENKKGILGSGAAGLCNSTAYPRTASKSL